MWLVGDGDLLLIGTNGDAIAPNLEGLATRWRRGDGARAPRGRVDCRAARRPSRCCRCSPAARPSCSGTAATRRFRATIGWRSSFPRRGPFTGGRRREGAASIRQLAEPGAAIPAARAVFGAGDRRELDGGRRHGAARPMRTGRRATSFARAVRLNTRNAEALGGLTDAAAGAHRQDEERQWLESLATAEPDNAAVRVELSRLLAATGNLRAGGRGGHRGDAAGAGRRARRRTARVGPGRRRRRRSAVVTGRGAAREISVARQAALLPRERPAASRDALRKPRTSFGRCAPEPG